jgi:VanZ family protein
MRYYLARSFHWYRTRTVLMVWIVLLLVVATGELLPGSSAPMRLLSELALGDKIIHFCAYAVLAFLPAVGLRFSIAAVCVVITESVGVALEFAQTAVSGRSCDIYDIAANTGGVIAGIGLAMILRARVMRRFYLPR